MLKINKLGIVLSEALISVAMMATGAIILSSIVTNAVQTTRLSKGYLIAQNLATEGLEAVKSVRNSNWLNYTDTAECWLDVDYKNPCDSTDNFPAEVNGTEYVPRVWNGEWILEEGPGGVDLDLNNYSGTMEGFRLYLSPDGVYETSGTADEVSPYYRSINFLEVTSSYAVLEVKVEWLDGSQERNITRRITMFNYF